MNPEQEIVNENVNEKEEETVKQGSFKEVKSLFIWVELISITLFILLSSFGFLWFVTKHPLFSGITSIVVTIYFVVVFTIPNRRLRNYQHNLSELMKYVNNMVFYLQSGENVLHSLIQSKETVDKEVAKDIDKTIEILREEAVLELDHFKKYKFPSLDQFHRNLEIRDDRGGDTKELFDRIQDSMLFELKKRDELDKKKTGIAIGVYTLIGMVASMMLILRVFVAGQWDLFLSFELASLSVIGVTVFLMLLNLKFLQKHSLDISVRV